MIGYIGYIRVSTAKQGVHGVSLQEQRDAISRYADRHNISVIRWLEERETAAKRGRPVFMEMLRLLRRGRAKGVIIHKLDRGVRNLKDWADVGDLVDAGVEVHFANEELDLHSRGGRLAADIQAVVAADYIRNLREETRKGFYGRLKQGFYPIQAPIGYLNNGGGKAKTIDPERGPMVRQAFELYATCAYSLDTLAEEMERRGLRTQKGKVVSVTALSLLLNNPFYIGVMRIWKTGEMFPGVHEPLISHALFNRVQEILSGKAFRSPQRHSYLFRRLLTCAFCGYSLIGEKQKGHVYYRCQTKGCKTKCVREEAVESELRACLTRINLNADELRWFKAAALKARQSRASERESRRKGLSLQLEQIKDRLSRLTDAFLDGSVDKEIYTDRKNALLVEQKRLEDAVVNFSAHDESELNEFEKNLELAGMALWSHEIANHEEKRRLVEILTSNRTVHGKSIVFEPSNPFRIIANREENQCCGPNRGEPRMLEAIIKCIPCTASEENSGEKKIRDRR